MKYIPTIGLEIHLQLNTESKMFCGCSNKGEFEPPNTTICPICMGHPGTLPTINEKAVEKVLRAGFALHCRINSESKFDRKNYFYPDLPKGYQISQYDKPLCEDGYFEVENIRIGITRIHLEEDTAKLFHTDNGGNTLVDFNRSGSPLMELVTEPQFDNAHLAKIFCQELQLMFRVLDISTTDMEKGHMRCEANVSVRPTDSRELGAKVEVKNINSFKALEKAIEYEVERQSKLLEHAQLVLLETRGWDDVKNITVSQRSKEEAHDYRYFPEPDLPPMQFSQDYLQKLASLMPELPLQKRARFMSEYGFDQESAALLTKDSKLSEWVEHVASELRSWLDASDGTVEREKNWEAKKEKLMKLIAAWTTTELFKLMNVKNTIFDTLKITAENFAEFLLLVYTGKVNSSAAQTILQEMFTTGGDPSAILEEKNLGQMDDEESLRNAVAKIVLQYPKQVETYKQGKTNVIQFLVGKVISETQGRAHPEKTKTMLEERLHEKSRSSRVRLGRKKS